MRVLFLQHQPCARARKYAVALGTVRPDVELGFAHDGPTLTETYGTGDELFRHWWKLGDKPARTLREVLSEFAPDIVHSHSDALTAMAIDLTGGRIPVLHDVHDLWSLSGPEAIETERRAIEESAALVTVSPELLDEISLRYERPPLTSIFPNYALERDLPPYLPPPDRPRADPPRMVYQGSLSTSGDHYDLREIFRAIAAQDVVLDVYPSRDVPAYRALALETPGLRCHHRLPPDRLQRLLPRYDWGWAGFNDERSAAHLDTALPNKVYEYAGCGLPTVTLPHRALSRLIGEEQLGICVDDVAQVAERVAAADLTALREGIAERRWQFTFEGNIGRIVSLYEALVREPIVGIAPL
jgi:glycosyltransferase involved in cell wall biosynthesis